MTDVERLDPVLNPILNKETHKERGRVLVTVGDQDVDFSPSFEIFLSTRDSVTQFTPDLCSRVTFVNFTITESSLQGQVFNIILKAERPDVISGGHNRKILSKYIFVYHNGSAIADVCAEALNRGYNWSPTLVSPGNSQCFFRKNVMKKHNFDNIIFRFKNMNNAKIIMLR